MATTSYKKETNKENVGGGERDRARKEQAPRVK